MKKFTLRIIAGSNVATIAAMLVTGYADRISPLEYPLLANIGLLFPMFLAIDIAFLVFWLTFKKAWAAIPVAGLLAGFGPVRVYAPLNVRASAPEGSIKVMSYNVFSLSTWDDTSQPSEILQYIARQNPDILCLQESAPAGVKAEAMDSVLHATMPYSDNEQNSTMAIYSRFPIVGKERIEYQTSGSNMSMAYFVETAPGDTTIVINNYFEITGISLEQRTQFKAMLRGRLEKDSAEVETRQLWSSLARASAVRAPQADAVARYVESHSGYSIILMGDFNDSPLSYTRRRIADNLADCYVAAGNGPGISYHYNAFFVRIDNIMCSGHWMPYECRVDNSIKASDHYPIICKLKRKVEVNGN